MSLQDDLDRAAGLADFEGFIETMVRRGCRSFDGWVQTWYSRLIQRYVDLVVRQACGLPDGLGGLLVSMPPQHGKSTLLAEAAPAYAFAKKVSLRTLLLTYGRDFSSRAITHCQGIMGDEAYTSLFEARYGTAKGYEQDERGRLHEVSLHADNRSLMMRILQQRQGRVAPTRGYYMASSPRSAVTGWGYDLGLLDDLIKNQEEALNPVRRAALEQLIKAVFFTRRSPTSAMALIMTRWHALDIAATVQALWQKAGIPHMVLELPAIAHNLGPPRPYDIRPPGQVLDPIRYGTRWYQEQRALIDDPDLWDALYDQRPRFVTGASFLDEHWGDFDPQALRKGGRVERIALSIDPNLKPDGTSFAHIDVGALVRDDAHGLEAWKLGERQGKWDIAEFCRVTIELARTWSPTDILLEDTASGPALLALLKDPDALGPAQPIEEPGRFGSKLYPIVVLRNRGRPIRVHLIPHGGLPKNVRIELGSPFVTTGVCRLPAGSLGHITTTWRKDHLAEFRAHPHGRNNDRLDTWTQFVRWASEHGLRPRWSTLRDLFT